MPSVMIYLRGEDYDKYLVITARGRGEWGKFLHEKLNESLAPAAPPAKVLDTSGKEISGKFCPNGHLIPEGRTKCLGKGCRYS
jgi:hypothetical protein